MTTINQPKDRTLDAWGKVILGNKAQPNVSLKPASLTKEFQVLEATIRKNLKAWEKVGEALTLINAHEYQKERGFRTFESYVESVWDMSRDYAYKLMRGYEIIKILKMAGIKPGDMPGNESQVRPLTTVKPEGIDGLSGDQIVVMAYQNSLIVAGKGRITAKIIKEELDKIMGKPAAIPADKEDKAGNEPEKPVINPEAGKDLPDTSLQSEIDRLNAELHEARQRAALAESKLKTLEETGRIPLPKLGRDMINAGFKALAKSLDKDQKEELIRIKDSLLS